MGKLGFSVLDLCPVVVGESAAQAFQQTLGLARFVAQATRRMRVGSGGIMLPNHAPLRIAEAFRTLEAFHPGRIDLGIGRAPGTNTATAMALRRASDRLRADDFPEQIALLNAFLSSEFEAHTPYQDVVAMPTIPTRPEIWMLGSSDYGARLAAELGLPYAFAQAQAAPLTPAERDHFATMSIPKFVGSPETLRKALKLMVLTMIPDAEARKKSYAWLAEIL